MKADLPSPPPSPPDDDDDDDDEKRRKCGGCISLLEWMATPRVAEAPTAIWPAKANRFEPGFEHLDEQMACVLKIIQKANFGTGALADPDQLRATPPVMCLAALVLTRGPERLGRRFCGRRTR